MRRRRTMAKPKIEKLEGIDVADVVTKKGEQQ